MQIQNTNNTNFQAGYKFIRMSGAAREELDRVIPKGKTVYDNFEGKKSNVFLVTRDKYYNKLAHFIKNNNLQCRYYPEIKPEEYFKAIDPQILSERIKKQTPEEICITEHLSESIERRAVNDFGKNYGRKCVDNIIKALNLSMDKESMSEKFGSYKFKNLEHTKGIFISAPSNDRIFYVKISPLVSTTAQQPTCRYAMSPEGKILRDYTNDIDNWAFFNKKFNATLVK